MQHRVRGRKLGRNPSHRRAMFRNMANSLIRSVRVDEDDRNKPKVLGRIVTTLAKAKELRPFVEKLVTLARKAIEHQERAAEFNTSAERNSAEWKSWRDSEKWNQWNQAIAPAVAYRRRAFALLRDNQAVDILFDELAERFVDRQGGYTRVVRLPTVRLGDAGQKALIEFVGERDRVKTKRKAPVVQDEQPSADTGESQGETESTESQTADEPAEEAQEPTDTTADDVTDETQGPADSAESEQQDGAEAPESDDSSESKADKPE